MMGAHIHRGDLRITCERCGAAPDSHTPTHWCDNQSFSVAPPQLPALTSVGGYSAVEPPIRVADFEEP